MRLLYWLAVWVFALSASAFAAPSPSPSPSPSPTPPAATGIKILDCSLEYNSFNGVAAKMHVDFMNLNAQPVTKIRFRVETGFSTFAVMDFGSFAPNLKIHHDLDPPETHVGGVHSAITGSGPRGLYCDVDAYTLSNGYTWISPRFASELQAQQQKTQ